MSTLPEKNIQISKYTSFKLGGTVSLLYRLEKVDELPDILSQIGENDIPFKILGGGFNVLINDKHLDIAIIKNEIKGIEVLEENNDSLTIRAGSGVVWDDLVEWTVDRDILGLEPLSLIPGTVGASPVQNIGAYGTEVSDLVVDVETYDTLEKKFIKFSNADCEFEYRNSRFKSKDAGRFIILFVSFRLSKNQEVNMTPYKGVQEKLSEMKIKNPKLVDIRNAIISIRQSKLPDPSVIANVGSFFVNPVVDSNKAVNLKKNFPEMPQFETERGFKIPAGWLIENVGVKGEEIGSIKISDKNALVLINKGDATLDDVLKAEDFIKTKVQEKFDINLVREPVIIK